MDPVLATRVRTSRELGADASLVLHGGGNTSAKGEVVDLLGRRRAVICVKGSGWDLATIEAPGLPALDLEALRELRALDELSDEDMVRELRRCLLDPASPTPSVETLLHAFLPHRFIDHSHADAVLALSNREGGEALCREVYGDRVVALPFIMPGFPLAKAVAEAVEAHPEVEGVLLHHHGLFTFGDSGEESLERHRELVALAEARYAEDLAATRAATAPDTVSAAELLPRLRGAMAAAGFPGKPILEVRDAPWIRAALAAAGAEARLVSPPLTPDHTAPTSRGASPRAARAPSWIRCRGCSWCPAWAWSAWAATPRPPPSLPTSPSTPC
ncbi:MAG: class II aldolase/adducin family protein [Planctomycetota bacterium]|jgi:rhamnose utilization protein RhaD (predicted bifunctional aldolase and dehydrogenase)